MNLFTEPKILTDKSRLQEIFDLRVYAWENSPSPANINRETYPNGFFDDLDETAVHWVSFDDGLDDHYRAIHRNCDIGNFDCGNFLLSDKG